MHEAGAHARRSIDLLTLIRYDRTCLHNTGGPTPALASCTPGAKGGLAFPGPALARVASHREVRGRFLVFRRHNPGLFFGPTCLNTRRCAMPRSASLLADVVRALSQIAFSLHVYTLSLGDYEQEIRRLADSLRRRPPLKEVR